MWTGLSRKEILELLGVALDSEGDIAALLQEIEENSEVKKRTREAARHTRRALLEKRRSTKQQGDGESEEEGRQRRDWREVEKVTERVHVRRDKGGLGGKHPRAEDEVRRSGSTRRRTGTAWEPRVTEKERGRRPIAEGRVRAEWMAGTRPHWAPLVLPSQEPDSRPLPGHHGAPASPRVTFHTPPPVGMAAAQQPSNPDSYS